MDKQLMDDLRVRLEIEQDRLKTCVMMAGDHTQANETPALYSTSEYVQSANDEELECSLEKCQSELYEVQRALERMHSGTYGKCVICEDQITEQRLIAVPEADFCFECACRQPLRPPKEEPLWRTQQQG